MAYSNRYYLPNYWFHTVNHIPVPQLADDGFGNLLKVESGKRLMNYLGWYEGLPNQKVSDPGI